MATMSKSTTTEMEVSGPTEYNKLKTTKIVGQTASKKKHKHVINMKLKVPVSSVKKKTNYPTKKYSLVARKSSETKKLGSQGSPLLNTPGCKIPEFDQWDSTVASLIELQNPLICSDLPLFMKSQPGGSILLNKTVLIEYYHLHENELNCTYQSFRRKYEEAGNVRGK